MPPTTRRLAAGPGKGAGKGAGGQAVAAEATGTAVRWTRRRPGWPVVLLVAGVAVQLVPFVVFPTVLTQDGPAHVAGAWVLASWGAPGPLGGVLHAQYRIDLEPVPNMLTTLVMAGLIRVGVAPDLAERLVVVGLVVALVAALGWAARGVRRRAGWLAAAALPLAGSHLVAYGFYNFCWGVVGALLVLGLALRRERGWSVRTTAALALLLAGTWAAHLLPFTLAAAGIALLGLARAWEERRAGTPSGVAARRHLAPLLLAAVPSAALTAVYLTSGPRPAGRAIGGPSWARLAEVVGGVRPFAVGSRAEWVPAAVVVAALVALVALAARRHGSRAGDRITSERFALGVLLVASVPAVLLTPDRLGTGFGFLVDRLAWFPPLFAVLWAATRPPGPRATRAIAVVLLVAASAAVAVRLPWQAATSRDVGEFLSVAPDLRPDSTFVVLRYASDSQGRPSATPDPLRHESSRLAIRTDSVDVGHYEAVEPGFQVTFSGGPDLRARLDPGHDGLERIPPDVDLAAVRGRLDYVLVVGLDRAGPRVRSSPLTKAVHRELAEHYEQVSTSSPSGLVQVWRARDTVPSVTVGAAASETGPAPFQNGVVRAGGSARSGRG